MGRYVNNCSLCGLSAVTVYFGTNSGFAAGNVQAGGGVGRGGIVAGAGSVVFE